MYLQENIGNIIKIKNQKFVDYDRKIMKFEICKIDH